ncbi:MAG: PadR family transcriptional regulator [Acidobacteriota bacterium]|nr:PadR family transcriptional regulator [Acidobacteriota bacterium]
MNPLIHGTLESLILRTLHSEPRHGYGIARYLEEASADALQVGEGSLYPALYRMEKKGWIDAEWRASELGRRAKFYRLTDDGRAQLARETAKWRAFADAVSRVLLPAGEHR